MNFWSKNGLCFPALELFCCLPLWETEFFHRGRQQKSSRAGKQSPFQTKNSFFRDFQPWVLDFLLDIVRVTVGGKNHYYSTNAFSPSWFEGPEFFSKPTGVFNNFLPKNMKDFVAQW